MSEADFAEVLPGFTLPVRDIFAAKKSRAKKNEHKENR
jgi:hypothetical protein